SARLSFIRLGLDTPLSRGAIPIPKGLRPPAQGCEARATLGNGAGEIGNPNGVVASARDQHNRKASELAMSATLFPRGMQCPNSVHHRSQSYRNRVRRGLTHDGSKKRRQGARTALSARI